MAMAATAARFRRRRGWKTWICTQWMLSRTSELTRSARGPSLPRHLMRRRRSHHRRKLHNRPFHDLERQCQLAHRRVHHPEHLPGRLLRRLHGLPRRCEHGWRSKARTRSFISKCHLRRTTAQAHHRSDFQNDKKLGASATLLKGSLEPGRRDVRGGPLAALPERAEGVACWALASNGVERSLARELSRNPRPRGHLMHHQGPCRHRVVQAGSHWVRKDQA